MANNNNNINSFNNNNNTIVNNSGGVSIGGALKRIVSRKGKGKKMKRNSNNSGIIINGQDVLIGDDFDEDDYDEAEQKQDMKIVIKELHEINRGIKALIKVMELKD